MAPLSSRLTSTAGRRRTSGSRRAFDPWKVPAAPPPGTYDPTLDAQLRAAVRGFGDLTQDTEQALQRGGSDYANARADTQMQSGYTLADLLRDRQRGNADFERAEDQVSEQYGKNKQTMLRNYGERAVGQQSAALQAGVASGGTLAASMQARAKNQGRDQGEMRDARDRALRDIDRQQDRFNADSTQGEGRLATGTDLQLGRLGESYGRQGNDLATALARAGREMTFFDQDVGAQRFFQAAQSGQYVMPQRGEPGGPASNEFSGPRGPYRVIMVGGRKVRVGPNGRPI